MRQLKLIIATVLLIAPFASHADLIGDYVEAELSNPAGGQFDISDNFGAGIVGPGVEFSATATDVFNQVWDFSLDVQSDGFTVGWTERTRDGDGNITDGDDMIRIALSDLDWVGMMGEIVGVTLDDYSCVSPGFSCATFGGGPSVTAIEWGVDWLYVDFNTLRHGELYSFNIDAIHVPEPGTLALLGIGLFGMGLAKRKKA